MNRSVLILLISALSPIVNALDQRPVLSLVIDDLGYSFKQGAAAIELPGDHTYAIIPGTLYGRKLAEFARLKSKEVILHLPLQASSISASSESNTLNESMNEDQITENTLKMLSEFPNIKGINNHMGSRLTEIDYFMRPIMESIKSFSSKLYFLDSRTSSRSIAYYQAKNSGLDSIRRDVFLDNEHGNIESLRLQFKTWLLKARRRGSAVAIGHPHKSTISFLTEYLPRAEKFFRFKNISALIATDKEDSNVESESALISNLELNGLKH